MRKHPTDETAKRRPIFSAERAEVAIKRARPGSVRYLILKDRIDHQDASRNAQSQRLGVIFMTLTQAEEGNRWPIGAAGKLLRAALGVADEAKAAS